jgi:hypothetical protein
VKKEKEYELTRFSPEVVREAVDELWKDVPSATKEPASGLMSVEVDDARWTHDSEDEFFADYRRSRGTVSFVRDRAERSLHIIIIQDHSTVYVTAPSRAVIERVFSVFERNEESSAIPPPPEPPEDPPVVFVGHGRSAAWRDLKDHLHEQHGFDVSAYEIGARAGHTIRDILEEMLDRSSFAILVMTAEDELLDGTIHPRQNVVHEAGLFQGRLGFARAIMLLEEGAEAFSNIQGVHQIRFDRGRIKETFGDVLATLSREFPGAV